MGSGCGGAVEGRSLTCGWAAGPAMIESLLESGLQRKACYLKTAS